MSFPNYPDKHKLKSFVIPEDFIASKKGLEVDMFADKKGMIIFYDFKILQYVKRIGKELIRLGDKEDDRLIVYSLSDDVITIGNFGIGAPNAVTVMEEFVTMGVKNFISIGSCGSLQNKVTTGSIVLCSKAIRDEGTSLHYLPKSKFAHPSKKLNDEIAQFLRSQNIKYFYGPTWTIDAPYRETNEEIKQYSQEGILTVEMEASALFALSRVHGVNVASIFTISDLLYKKGWEPKFDRTEFQNTKLKLLDIAHAVLANL